LEFIKNTPLQHIYILRHTFSPVHVGNQGGLNTRKSESKKWIYCDSCPWTKPSSCHWKTALKTQKLPHTDWTNVPLTRQLMN